MKWLRGDNTADRGHVDAGYGDLVELARGQGPQLRGLDTAAASDPLEREADRIATQVKDGDGDGDGDGATACNQLHGGACAGSAAGTLQRAAEPASPVGPATSIGPAGLARIEAAVPPSSGSPLAGDVRRRIEPVLGVDLGHVRVHTDGKARGTARELRARAFTYGSNIWLGPDQRADDVELLAHEAAHVVQQGAAGRAPRVQRKPDPVTLLWEDVTGAYSELIFQIGLINQKAVSPTRNEWIGKLASGLTQAGAPGEKIDAELQRLRANLDALKKEIEKEDAQAHESWKVDVAAYQDERKALEGEKEEWAPGAIKILDAKYADTVHAVQVAGAYLTFDDMVPLEYMLKQQQHRVYAEERIERQKQGPGTGSTMATGAGLGAVFTYQGKTLVRIGGEKFYISGTPPKGTWIPPGGSTSEFFIYKQSDPRKMYRLDYDTIKMGPKAGTMGWEHNQKGVAKILGLKVTNHQPAGGWGKVAGTAIRIYKWGGRALFVAGLVSTALEIYYAEDKAKAVVKAGGALAAGVAGAEGGALAGAEIGGWFGPFGAGIGAFVGGLGGGGLAAWGGSKATEYVYDLVAEPLDAEDDWVVLSRDQVEPVPGDAGGGN